MTIPNVPMSKTKTIQKSTQSPHKQKKPPKPPNSAGIKKKKGLKLKI